jgi:hypothetical protein
MLVLLIGVYRLMLRGPSSRRYERSWTRRRDGGWIEQIVPTFNSRRAATRVGSVTGDNMALLLATASVVTSAFDGAGRLATIPGIPHSTGNAIAAIVVLLIVLYVLNTRLASTVAGVIGLGVALIGILLDHGPAGALTLVVTLTLPHVTRALSGVVRSLMRLRCHHAVRRGCRMPCEEDAAHTARSSPRSLRGRPGCRGG